MAYFLNNASSASAGINIPSVVIGATVGDYIEIKAVANSGNPSNNYRLAGLQSGYSNFIEIRPASAWLGAGGSGMGFTTGYTQPPVGSVFTVRFTRASSTTWRCTLNGAVLGADLSNSGNCTLDAFFRFSSSATEAFRGGIYYIAISTNGGASVTRYYDPSASGGTGSALIDTAGGQNGSQVGTWPADDSEWVFYSTGGTTSASVAVTMPQFTASVAASKTAPSFAASISATMPQMVVAASAQSLAPSSGAAISFTMPQMSASVIADNLVPVFASAVSVTMPQFAVSASAENALPGSGAVVSFTMPQMVAAVSASKTVPTYSASVAATMPQFAVSVTGSALVYVKSASISFTMPQFSASVAGSNVVPIRQASVGFTMPQMRAQILTGGVAFYQDPRAHIELVAASRHLEYTNSSRHIELRRA